MSPSSAILKSPDCNHPVLSSGVWPSRSFRLRSALLITPVLLDRMILMVFTRSSLTLQPVLALIPCSHCGFRIGTRRDLSDGRPVAESLPHGPDTASQSLDNFCGGTCTHWSSNRVSLPFCLRLSAPAISFRAGSVPGSPRRRITLSRELGTNPAIAGIRRPTQVPAGQVPGKRPVPTGACKELRAVVSSIKMNASYLREKEVGT